MIPNIYCVRDLFASRVVDNLIDYYLSIYDSLRLS